MPAVDKARVDELLDRPTITPEEALQVLPLSRNGLYEALRRGDITSIRIGKKILVPTGPLRRLLGIES
jgi:excisionase family DNA binding protein